MCTFEDKIIMNLINIEDTEELSCAALCKKKYAFDACVEKRKIQISLHQGKSMQNAQVLPVCIDVQVEMGFQICAKRVHFTCN